MKVFSEALLKEVEQQLYVIHTETAEPLVVAAQAIKLLLSALDTLKSHCLNHPFENKKEEIDFFKNSKPQFTAKLIYYTEIYTIESKKPVGTTKEIRKYYKEEWRKLKLLFKQHSELYRYLRTGNNSLDKKYFLRGKTQVKHIQDSNYWHADHRFCTSHDFQVAKIIANEQLAIYFEKAISKTENKLVNGTDSSSKKTQKWTAPKVALIELIYALHSYRGCVQLRYFRSNRSDLLF